MALPQRRRAEHDPQSNNNGHLSPSPGAKQWTLGYCEAKLATPHHRPGLWSSALGYREAKLVLKVQNDEKDVAKRSRLKTLASQ